MNENKNLAEPFSDLVEKHSLITDQIYIQVGIHLSKRKMMTLTVN